MAKMYVWASDAYVVHPPFKQLHVAHVWVTDYPAPACGPGPEGPLSGGGFQAYAPPQRYWSCFSGPPGENGCRNVTPPGRPYAIYDCDDIQKAVDIVRPNDPTDNGGLSWGTTGTCQQVSNRILWPAKRSLFGLGTRRTCMGVTGWVLSFLWFGPYGATPFRPAGSLFGMPVDFLDYARAKLNEDLYNIIVGLRNELLQEKERLDRQLNTQAADWRARYAESINSLTADFLWQARQALDFQAFQSVFLSDYERGYLPTVLDPTH